MNALIFTEISTFSSTDLKVLVDGQTAVGARAHRLAAICSERASRNAGSLKTL
jgi:hypothetical protein